MNKTDSLLEAIATQSFNSLKQNVKDNYLFYDDEKSLKHKLNDIFIPLFINLCKKNTPLSRKIVISLANTKEIETFLNYMNKEGIPNTLFYILQNENNSVEIKSIQSSFIITLNDIYLNSSFFDKIPISIIVLYIKQELYFKQIKKLTEYHYGTRKIILTSNNDIYNNIIIFSYEQVLQYSLCFYNGNEGDNVQSIYNINEKNVPITIIGIKNMLIKARGLYFESSDSKNEEALYRIISNINSHFRVESKPRPEYILYMKVIPVSLSVKDTLFYINQFKNKDQNILKELLKIVSFPNLSSSKWEQLDFVNTAKMNVIFQLIQQIYDPILFVSFYPYSSLIDIKKALTSRFPEKTLFFNHFSDNTLPNIIKANKKIHIIIPFSIEPLSFYKFLMKLKYKSKKITLYLITTRYTVEENILKLYLPLSDLIVKNKSLPNLTDFGLDYLCQNNLDKLQFDKSLFDEAVTPLNFDDYEKAEGVIKIDKELDVYIENGDILKNQVDYEQVTINFISKNSSIKNTIKKVYPNNSFSKWNVIYKDNRYINFEDILKNKKSIKDIHAFFISNQLYRHQRNMILELLTTNPKDCFTSVKFEDICTKIHMKLNSNSIASTVKYPIVLAYVNYLIFSMEKNPDDDFLFDNAEDNKFVKTEKIKRLKYLLLRNLQMIE